MTGADIIRQRQRQKMHERNVEALGRRSTPVADNEEAQIARKQRLGRAALATPGAANLFHRISGLPESKAIGQTGLTSEPVGGDEEHRILVGKGPIPAAHQFNYPEFRYAKAIAGKGPSVAELADMTHEEAKRTGAISMPIGTPKPPDDEKFTAYMAKRRAIRTGEGAPGGMSRRVAALQVMRENRGMPMESESDGDGGGPGYINPMLAGMGGMWAGPQDMSRAFSDALDYNSRLYGELQGNRRTQQVLAQRAQEAREGRLLTAAEGEADRRSRGSEAEKNRQSTADIAQADREAAAKRLRLEGIQGILERHPGIEYDQAAAEWDRNNGPQQPAVTRGMPDIVDLTPRDKIPEIEQVIRDYAHSPEDAKQALIGKGYTEQEANQHVKTRHPFGRRYNPKSRAIIQERIRTAPILPGGLPFIQNWLSHQAVAHGLMGSEAYDMYHGIGQ